MTYAARRWACCQQRFVAQRLAVAHRWQAHGEPLSAAWALTAQLRATWRAHHGADAWGRCAIG